MPKYWIVMNFGSKVQALRKSWSAILLCLLIQTWIGAASYGATRVQAQKGEIDLKDWDGQTTYALYGEWLFAGRELLTPRSFLKALAGGREFKTIVVGQPFGEVEPEKFKKSQGYATYVLRLKNLAPSTIFAMTEIAAYVSSRIYFFDAEGHGGDQPIRELGFVASNAKRTKSEISNNEPLPFRSYAAGDHYILIQVANFHHSWGGLWAPPQIANLAVIISQNSSNTMADYFVFGVMGFIAFYNFMLFLYRREDRGSLYLAGIALTLFFRTWLFANYGRDFFGDGYWGVQLSIKAVYISLFTLTWSAFRSSQTFFPKQCPAWMDKLLPRLCIVGIILIAVFPSRFFGPFSNLLFIIGMVTGVCSAYIALRAAMARDSGSRLVGIGILSVLIGSVFEFGNATGLLPLGRNYMTYGMTIYAACLSQIISTRFALAFRQAQHLSEELHTEVQRQTRDIRSLLDNLKQGIFTVVEGTQLVGSQFSAYLKHIIGRERIEGQSLRTLLLDHSDLSPDNKDMVEAAVNAALGEDLMNFEVNAGILVRDLTFLHPHSNLKQSLELDWSPIYDQDERVEKLLVSVRDITEIKKLRDEARVHEEDFEILKELIDVAEDRFMRFMHQAQDFLEQNRKIIAQAEAPDSVQRLFINMHSLKGIARSYSLANLANAIHLAEETLSQMRAGAMAWNPEHLETDRRLVETVCLHYKSMAQDKLGWREAGSTLRIVKPKIEDLIHHLRAAARDISQTGPRLKLACIEQQLLALCHQPLSQVIDEASRGLDSLARSLDKEPPQLEVAVEGVILHEQTASALYGIFTHLFRNSLDHGLENKEQRLQASKNPAGRIMIRAEQSVDELVIFYQDDGRGLDLSKIIQKATEQGLWNTSRQHDDHAVAELIFVSGLSTKAQVTELSGRGVGMDAVRALLQQLGGDVEIQLDRQPNNARRNFRLLLRLPAHAFIQASIASVHEPTLRQTADY